MSLSIFNYFIEIIRSQILYVIQYGLKDDELLSIIFDTDNAEVELSEELRALHPKMMHVILQHDFQELQCHEDHFSVILSFSGKPELISIPFSAVSTLHNSASRIYLKKVREEDVCNFFINIKNPNLQNNNLFTKMDYNSEQNQDLLESMLENFFHKLKPKKNTATKNTATKNNIKIIPFKNDDKTL